MREFKKTKNLKANAIAIALLTVLMAAAVVFGGMGIMHVHAYSAFTLPSSHTDVTSQYIDRVSVVDQNGRALPKDFIHITEDVNHFIWVFSITDSPIPGATYRGSISSGQLCSSPDTGKVSGYIGFPYNKDAIPASIVVTMTVTYTAVPLPDDPVKEGYNFVGWYYDEAFTRPYDNAPIYADTQLYAKFEIKTFTVTFNSAGGSAVASQTVNWNTPATLSTPTKEGYTFLGWYNGNTKYTTQGITANTTLTAHWSIKAFSVTFDSAGGSAVASQTVEWNNPVAVTTPTRTGYTFLGWYNGETKYAGQAITADTTLTAHWEILRFTVTFYMDGEVYETMEVDYGTTFQEAMTANAKLCFMNLLNSEGIKVAKSGVITADVSAPVGNMTREEKVATFIGNNWWLLVVGGVLIVAGIFSTVIASVIAKKRK